MNMYRMIRRNTGAKYDMMPRIENKELKDYGPNALDINIREATLKNNKYRVSLWTGKYLQVTLMTIPAGESIGLEMHKETDQILHIVQGIGLLQMGEAKDKLTYEKKVWPSSMVIVPAGTWHNVKNISKVPLKLFSTYAPPHHKMGVVQETKYTPES